MSDSLTLAEFPPVSTEQWDEVVRKDLKGAAPKTKLYYRAEDLRGLEYLDSAPGEFPYTRGTRERQCVAHPGGGARCRCGARGAGCGRGRDLFRAGRTEYR
jgi:hypothetical protein